MLQGCYVSYPQPRGLMHSNNDKGSRKATKEDSYTPTMINNNKESIRTRKAEARHQQC
jgi:hypothetical protein